MVISHSYVKLPEGTGEHDISTGDFMVISLMTMMIRPVNSDLTRQEENIQTIRH